MTDVTGFKCNGAEKYDFSDGQWIPTEECSPETNIAGRYVRTADGKIFPYGSAVLLSPITHLFFTSEQLKPLAN